jgi:hypothetical protein
MTSEDDTLSVHTIGPDGREFNGHAIDRLEDAALAIVFDLAVCRAFVDDLSERDARRLGNACTWLREYTNGQRNPNGVAFAEIGRLM